MRSKLELIQFHIRLGHTHTQSIWLLCCKGTPDMELKREFLEIQLEPCLSSAIWFQFHMSPECHSLLPLPYLIDEHFGLGRFATDHSFTKAASRPLFICVRRYAPQTTTLTRPCLCYK